MLLHCWWSKSLNLLLHAQMVMEMLMDLDERLFLRYIEHKSEALLQAIEEGMHAGLFDWEQCSVEPTGVRAYIQDIVLSLVSIHCEVGQ